MLSHIEIPSLLQPCDKVVTMATTLYQPCDNILVTFGNLGLTLTTLWTPWDNLVGKSFNPALTQQACDNLVTTCYTFQPVLNPTTLWQPEW